GGETGALGQHQARALGFAAGAVQHRQADRHQCTQGDQQGPVQGPQEIAGQVEQPAQHLAHGRVTAGTGGTASAGGDTDASGTMPTEMRVLPASPSPGMASPGGPPSGIFFSSQASKIL